MPGEFEPHAGCWMAWPQRPDNWRHGAEPAQRAFAAVAEAIVVSEPVTVGADDEQFERAARAAPPEVRVVELSTDDAWMRDIGPSFLTGRRRGARPARRGLALQRVGRALRGLGARRTRRREGARDRRRRALPRAAGARGRLDPRRRRGHRAHDRRVPAEPEPQPLALARADRARAAASTSARRR